MVANLHLMSRGLFVQIVDQVRALPLEDALVLRQASLVLLAHEMLATFHRSSSLASLAFKVDYSPESDDDRYEVSARNGFFELVGDDTPPREHGLRDTIAPLELMSSGTYVLHRTDPLVQLSLADSGRSDGFVHYRIVHRLATELDMHFAFP